MMGTRPDWRADLINAHPSLFHPRTLASKVAGGYPECEEGWRDLLERACNRIEVAVKGGSFRVRQIKEKFGTLRFYWSGELSSEAKANVSEAIALAEARSACTCEICGVEGRLHDRGGWLATACSEHSRGDVIAVKPGFENLYIYRKRIDGRLRVISCRRYDRDADLFVNVDPKSLGFEE